MPWTEAQVLQHTKKVGKSSKRRKQWVAVANSALKRTGDDATAIKEANGVAKKMARKRV